MSIRRLHGIAAAGAMLATISLIAPAMAQITLTNPNFELPGTVKTEYWDAAGTIVPGIIPGWEPTGPGVQGPGGPVAGPGDSGVEFGGTAGGTWQGYLAALDPSIFSTSTHNIIANRHYRARFVLRNIYTDAGFAATMQATLYYVDLGGNRVALGTPASALPTAAFAPFSMVLTPAEVAPGLGRPIGIELSNITNGKVTVNSWIAMDNIAIGATAANTADTNFDGSVTIADYGLIRDNIEKSAAPWSNGDVDGSGFVDLNDFRAWTLAAPPEVVALLGVPEPSTATLALLLLAGSVRRTRRESSAMLAP
jgi:hypothetical protein